VSDDLGLFIPEVHEGEHDDRPRGKAADARRSKRKRKRTVLWIVVALVLGVGGVGAYYGYQTLSGIGSYDDFSTTGEADVVIEVKDGDTVAAIGTTLKEQGVVASPRAFTEAGKGDARVTAIQPGFYLMKTKMSGSTAVTRMVDPKTKVTPLEIKGGFTLHDITGSDGSVKKGILTLMSEGSCVELDGKKKCVSVEELRAAAETADPAALGVPDWAVADVAKAPKENRLEGLIMRGLYHVKPGSSATEMLKTLITGSAARMQGYGIPSGTTTTGYRPYEILVIASLVEKEAIEKDMGKIARVIQSRLAIAQKLELDSTVNYKLDKPRLQTNDADREASGPFNTYQNTGLTPTPIGSPSEQAIAAALKPEAGPWLYFVKCQKDGTSCFNVTIEEHDAASLKAQREGVF
jgi:UPF0755 protein